MTRMPPGLQALTLGVFIALSSGCASRPSVTAPTEPDQRMRLVTVFGSRMEEAPGKTYFLAPGPRNAGVNDGEFRDFSQLADRTLRSAGLEPATSLESADLLILLEYWLEAESESTTACAHRMELTAVKANKVPSPPLWRTSAIAAAADHDLLRFFPVLLSAAAPYIGKDVRGSVEVSVATERARDSQR